MNDLTPHILRFSRRGVLRLRPQEDLVEVEDPTTPFPVELPENLIDPSQEVAAVRARLTDLMEQAGPASRLILEIIVQGLEKATASHDIPGPSILLAAQLVYFANFLADRIWLLQDSSHDPLRTKRQSLLLLVLDIDAFYSKCQRLARDYAAGRVSMEKKLEEDTKNVNRGKSFQQQLHDTFNSLLAVTPAELREDPSSHPLLREDAVFPQPYAHPMRAKIVSFSLCAPLDTYWKQQRGPGVDQALIDILNDTPTPSIKELLLGITQQLETMTSTQPRNEETADLLTDRAQFSSLQAINLDEVFAF